MDKVKEALLSGKVEVVDADLSSYFDTIPHRQLLQQEAKRVSDGSVLRLIKAWLRAPIVEEDRTTGRRKVMPNGCGRRKAESYRRYWPTSISMTSITR
jgi:retron-type reverse transcriptase